MSPDGPGRIQHHGNGQREAGPSSQARWPSPAFHVGGHAVAQIAGPKTSSPRIIASQAADRRTVAWRLPWRSVSDRQDGTVLLACADGNERSPPPACLIKPLFVAACLPCPAYTDRSGCWQHGHHRASQGGQVVAIDRQRRRQVDDVAEGAHPHARLDQPASLRSRCRPGPPRRRRPGTRTSRTQGKSRQGSGLLLASATRLRLRQPGSDSNRSSEALAAAGQRIAHRTAVHQRVRRVVGPEGVEHPVAGHRGGCGRVPPVSALDKVMMSGLIGLKLEGEHGAGARSR